MRACHMKDVIKEEHTIHRLDAAGHPEDAAVVVAILRGDAEPAGAAARNGQRPSLDERILGIGGEGRCSQGNESECD